MNSRPRLLPSALATTSLTGLLLAIGTSQAAIVDYSASATDTTWVTGANWTGGTAPTNDTTSSIARFNQTSYAKQPSAIGTVSVAGLVFGDGITTTAALTIDGGNLTIGSGGITMHDLAGASGTGFTGGRILAANQVWSNASTTNNLTISGVISGAYSIEKTGVGVLSFGSINTFSGGLTLTAGGLRAGQNGAFGTGTLTLNGGNISGASLSNGRVISNTVVVGGNVQFGNSVGTTVAALELTGPVTINGNRQISFVNNGVGVKGNVTLNGNLTLDTAIASIQTVSATNITNGLTTGGNTIAGVISDGSGSFGITKTGTGVVALTGANTFTGNITINQGTLSITNAFIADTSSVLINSGAIFNLNFSGTDSIAGLYLAGVAQAQGTYGAVGSGATFTSSFFSGTGILNVSAVPEPSTYGLIAGTLILGIAVSRRRSARRN